MRNLSLLVGGWLMVFVQEIVAQPYWASAGLPDTAGMFQQVWSDGTEAVYYAGVPDAYAGPGLQYSIARYSQGSWQRMDTLGGMVFSVVGWRDTLFAGGNFGWTKVKYWDVDRWRPYGTFDEFSGVRRLRVLNDTLYAVGTFASIDGSPFNGVAKRVSVNWVPVGEFPEPDRSLLDIVLYRDTLVVIGLVDFENGRSIAYLAPGESQWQLLGPGILGGMAGPHTLAVYQDDLYVGGQIPLSAGNAGQEIMRWNGTAFEPLGEGLQFTHGNLTSFCDVRAMVEHNGLLFVGGGCNFTGDLESRGVAIWDGEQWCSLPGDPTSQNGSVWGMAFLQDTLFIDGGYYADGQWMNQAIKYVGDLSAGTCTGPVGVMEEVPMTSAITWNVDADHVLRVQGLPDEARNCAILDMTGRTLLEWRSRGSEMTHALPASISTGAYLLRMDRVVVRFALY